MRILVNRKHYVETDDIVKITSTPAGVNILLSKGYPLTIKARMSKEQMVLRLINARVPLNRIRSLMK